LRRFTNDVYNGELDSSDRILGKSRKGKDKNEKNAEKYHRINRRKSDSVQ
jgi:hypothetical protein